MKKLSWTFRFWKQALSEEGEGYDHVGLQGAALYFKMDKLEESGFPVCVHDGAIVYSNGLHKKRGNKWIPFSDEFEFDFGKYIEQTSDFFDRKNVNVVSILLGTNDLYNVKYYDYEEKICKVVSNIEVMVNSVKAYNKDIKIIINLPVFAAGAVSGEANSNDTTMKQFRYVILSFCEKLLEKWDTDHALSEHIYISPMLNMLDMENGFDKQYIKKNKYSENTFLYFGNHIHPSQSGYKQMGDALSGVVAKAISTDTSSN